MKQRILLALCIAAATLLCACQQSAAIAEQLGDVAEIIQEVGPLPTVTPTPEPTAKPTYIPRITPTPAPTPKPTPSPTPSPTPRPTPTPSPTPSATPEPTTTPVPTPAPTVPPAREYAPMPQSVPFRLFTPTPTATPAPAAATGTAGSGEGGAAASGAGGEAVTPPSVTYATGQAVADFAQMYVGYSYVYGAASPETGFDCSGLVYYVYQQFGYTLNRVAAAQALNGTHVDHSDIEPGDILCFYTSGTYIGHVGIYIGDGQYVHAQSTATGVVTSPLSDRGDRYEARRILAA